MKRTYIKPFMESEEFVTNEYVAACFNVSCSEYGDGLTDCHYESFLIKGTDRQSAIDALLQENDGGNDSFHQGTSGHYGVILPESQGEYYHKPRIATGNWNHHKLNITDDGNHS